MGSGPTTARIRTGGASTEGARDEGKFIGNSVERYVVGLPKFFLSL